MYPLIYTIKKEYNNERKRGEIKNEDKYSVTRNSAAARRDFSTSTLHYAKFSVLILRLYPLMLEERSLRGTDAAHFYSSFLFSHFSIFKLIFGVNGIIGLPSLIIIHFNKNITCYKNAQLKSLGFSKSGFIYSINLLDLFNIKRLYFYIAIFQNESNL